MYFENKDNKSLISFLENTNITFEKNIELKKKSWLKAGGMFEIYIQPSTYNDIIKLVSFLKEKNYNYYVVGNLSNIIFRDGLIKTPIINIKKYDKITVNELENSIKVDACCGISIYKFANYISYKKNITGLEGLIGIPGLLGGAIVMNASSYDSYISEYLKEINFLNKDCEKVKIRKEDAQLEWRSSFFQNKEKLIILNAVFEFPKKNLLENNIINRNIEKVKMHRSIFQEKKLPNLGSLFATKNLYYDISKSNLTLKILYFLHKFLTKIIIRFSNENLLIKFRKFFVKIYSYFLDIGKDSPFKLSDRTINCLVNNNSENANEAIKIIKNYQKKINYKQKLENIIVDDII